MPHRPGGHTNSGIKKQACRKCGTPLFVAFCFPKGFLNCPLSTVNCQFGKAGYAASPAMTQKEIRDSSVVMELTPEAMAPSLEFFPSPAAR